MCRGPKKEDMAPQVAGLSVVKSLHFRLERSPSAVISTYFNLVNLRTPHHVHHVHHMLCFVTAGGSTAAALGEFSCDGFSSSFLRKEPRTGDHAEQTC